MSCTRMRAESTEHLSVDRQQHLQREEALSLACRCLYVRNLPFNISSEEMHDIFGKFGAIRQIRQ